MNNNNKLYINYYDDTLSEDLIKEIFDEVMRELNDNGYTNSIIDDSLGITKFYLIIPKDKLNCDSDTYKLLKMYLDKMFDGPLTKSKNSIKYLIIKLLMRITPRDLDNINCFLAKQIYYTEYMLPYASYHFQNEKLRLMSNMAIGYESPVSLGIIIRDKEYRFQLPDVFYGIVNDVCNVYAIQNLKLTKSPLQKKYNRLFYGFNEGLSVNNFMGYNIADVTMSFLFSAFVFMYEVQKSGITKVIINPPLPLFRYNKVNQIAEKKLQSPELAVQLDESLVRILGNTKEKYYATFLRLCYHFPNLKVLKTDDEGIEIEVGPFIDKTNNPLFNRFLEELDKNRMDNLSR